MSAKRISDQVAGEVFHREGSFVRGSGDEEQRTVELSFSSENPVSRYFGAEILDHSKKAVDLDRLNDSAPLLLNHDPNQQVGVVESAQINSQERKGRAVVRFSRSQKGEEIYQDVRDGIRKNVSVGYRINELVLEKTDKTEETYRATSWTPMEISLASIPADQTVGVGRAQNLSKPQEPIKTMDNEQTQPAPAASPAVTPTPETDTRSFGNGAQVTVDEKQVRAQEARRTADIIAGARKWNIDADVVDSYIRDGKSVAQFNELVMSTLESRNQPTPLGDGGIGLSRKEAKQWSFARAIRSVLNNGRVDGFEREVSDEVAKRLGQDPAGFYIPTDIPHEKRALTADTASTGGYLVDDDLRTGSFIEILRNKMKVRELGAQMLTGLTSNVTIPTQETAATAEVESENSQLTGSNPTFGQKTLSPHRIGAKVPISKQLIQQSGTNVESIVRNDIAQVIALEVDRQCLHGNSGTAGEIIGLANTNNINTVTFGATATWAKAIEFETDVAAANGDIGTMAYLADAATRGAWKGIKKDSGSGIFIWENNMVNGYRAEVSQQVSGSVVFFGVWNQLLIGEFGAIDVVVDNLTLADKHQVQLVVNYLSDMVVRQPAAFSVSTDSGNQ